MDKITNDEFADYASAYQTGLYHLAYAILNNKADAQDAVSEALTKAFEHRNDLRDRSKFRPWIMKIVMSVAKTMLRKRKRSILTEDIDLLQSESVTETKYSDLLEMVMTLEPKFRIVVILYYYESFSTVEISEIMKIPEGTVRSRLTRAREKLRHMIE